MNVLGVLYEQARDRAALSVADDATEGDGGGVGIDDVELHTRALTIVTGALS